MVFGAVLLPTSSLPIVFVKMSPSVVATNLNVWLLEAWLTNVNVESLIDANIENVAETKCSPNGVAVEANVNVNGKSVVVGPTVVEVVVMVVADARPVAARARAEIERILRIFFM